MRSSTDADRTARQRGEAGDGPVHPVDQVPPANRLVPLGLQHVLAMYAGAVAVPIVLAGALGLPESDLVYLISADLFTCGLATLVQTIGFRGVGFRLPIMQGAAFAVLPAMILIGEQHGLRGVYGAIIVAGLVVFAISPYFSRMLRFFPPVVTGSIITVIGISLLPVAVDWSAGEPPGESSADPAAVALALGVLMLIVLLYRLLPGFLRRVAILLGATAGTVVAALVGLADFGGVADAGWVGVTTPFHFGAPTFDLAAIAAMTLAMLVVMVESTGNGLAVGEIVDRPVDQRRLASGLRADGLSTALGGVLNAFPYTVYAQNAGLVRLTGVRSRYVVAAAGAMLVLIGLAPKLAAIVASVPLPVLGGAGFVLFGAVAAIGIRTLARVDFDRDANILIVAVSLGLGLVPIAIPGFYEQFPQGVETVFGSGITAASVAAVGLNALFNVIGQGEERRPARDDVAAPSHQPESTPVAH